eukprot:gene6079-6782_t
MAGEIEDLELLFEILDTDYKGYLTQKEIQLFEESTFFESLDSDQIDAALYHISGKETNKVCEKNKFRSLLIELERRRNLENQIKWDFNALDGNCDGRISLQSALFLFKSVHVDKFSVYLWNSFLSTRPRPEEEVSFHEIKMFLCNIPQHISVNEDEYDEYSNQVKQNQIERDYNMHQSFVAWQENDGEVAKKEREKQFRTARLKNSADHLIDRLEEVGLQALLEEDDGLHGRMSERPVERVNATDLLNALKDKYDLIRDHLLLEMLKLHIGEGMMAAWSKKEQNERLFQVKIKEENLRKDGRSEEMVNLLPGTKNKCKYTLLWLMGESMSELREKDLRIKDKMKESGMEREDVLEEFDKKVAFDEQQSITTDELLLLLNHRLISEKEIVSNRLQGVDDYATMSVSEREQLFCLLYMMQLRALNEQSFESASLAVGLTERLGQGHRELSNKDRKRQEQLAMKRLLLQKGNKSIISDKDWFTPIADKRKQVQGRIDKQMQVVQNMEKRLLLEREAFINFLQSKDSTHYRIKAKRLNSDERSNQLLVLKTQWQGWQSRGRDEKISAIEQHRIILQEAISIVFENKKDSMRLLSPNTVDDLAVACSLVSALQFQQDNDSKNIINFNDKQSADLDRMALRELKSREEEWFENIAAVIFDIRDISNEEEELIKALNEKYDAVRDKLLLEALKQQMSEAEWAKLSEQERQAKLMKLKLMERRLRRDGKFEEAAAILGDGFKNADKIQSLLGESRQRYQDKLQERLKARKKRIADGEEVDEDEEDAMADDETHSTGNILKDLQMRYEQEKDALFRQLQEDEGRYLNERERQAELIRLKMEKRKAEREGNFEGAALVLGIAERNSAAREEGLKKDRERQEKLAKERLEAMRNAKRKRQKDAEDPEPNKDDDVSVWQDSVMKELEKKQAKERQFLADILNSSDVDDLCDEARNMPEDERAERIGKLKDKREELDFEDKSDQEEHGAILEMAAAVKMVIREVNLQHQTEKEEISRDDVSISLLADLQQIQDKETDQVMREITEKTQEELAALRTKQMKSRHYEELSNVAELMFTYEGKSTDHDIIKALDKKYDALMDKLILEGLQNQLGQAEWQAMSERERQAQLLKRRLEQKRLLREGKLEEAAKLLGDSFQTDANLKKLMGQNRARYEEMVKEKLAKRRERQRLGLEATGDDDEDEFEIDQSEEGGKIDAKTLLEDMQKRYEDEKEALMMKLKGADARFYSEKERQAELARLRREERKVKLEEKFGTAAMVLGLAERNQAALESKLKSDRARQELLAKERLEKLREKRRMNRQEMKVLKDGDISKLKENAMKCIEYRHNLEREALVDLFREEKKSEIEKANCMTFDNREARLEQMKNKLMAELLTIDNDKWTENLNEMSVLKEVNRLKRLEKNEEMQEISRNDIVVSLIADLQEEQDGESEKQMERMLTMERGDVIALQESEVEVHKLARWRNIVTVISAVEKSQTASEDVLVDALESKYEILKDKLILEALEKKIGSEEWNSLSEEEMFEKLMEVKMKMKQLMEEGKTDELNAMLADLFPDQMNLDALMSLNTEAERERLEEKERLRKERREAGMSEEEINELERKEDQQFEEELRKKSPKNLLLQLERNFDAEKDALLESLKGVNAKYASERERQAELARIKREQRRARKEDQFESAALVMSLAKTQKETLDNKLKLDRERQEKLAKERLLARKMRRQQAYKQEEKETERDSDDVNVLQEYVLNAMEKKHADESEFLLQIIQNSSESSYNPKTKELNIVGKQQRINELKILRTHWREAGREEMLETTNEQMEIFEEAICLKIQMILDEISNKGYDEEKQLEIASIRILADLQENQDKEAEHLLKDLPQKNMMTLKQLCKAQRMACEEKWYDNIAGCLLGIIKRDLKSSEDISENEIVDALDSKYSELKEKLFIEILKRKYGESEWEAMSKEEQHKLLQQLRDDEKRLRNGEEVPNSPLKDIDLDGLDLGEGNVDAKDLLKNMQDEYNAEKDAILANLKDADAKMRGEKERQEALFKLRREQRRLKREDKFDSAAIIFNMAQERNKKQEKSFEVEKARQKELAMKRIAAARKKKSTSSESLQEKLIKEQNVDIENEIRYADEIEREGKMALQNIVMDEMEKKHLIERDILVELIPMADSDEEAMAATNYLSRSQKEEKIFQLKKERDSWKKTSFQASLNQIPDNEMTENEKTANAARVVEEWEEHKRILVKALVIRIEDIKQTLRSQQVDEDKLSEEVTIMLLAELQEKQASESNAVSTVITDKEEDFLIKVKDEQKTQRRERWVENVATLLLGTATTATRKPSASKAPDMMDISEEQEELEEMLEGKEHDELESLEREMQMEKEKRNVQGLSEDEMMKVMAELQSQQEAKKKAIMASIEKQRADAKRRLEEKRKKRDEKQYEEDIAMSIITAANARSDMIREKTTLQKKTQKDSLEERLRRRKEERKRKAELEAQQIKDEEEEEKRKNRKISIPLMMVIVRLLYTPIVMEDDGYHAEEDLDEEVVEEEDNPGGGLRREKTVVEEAAEMDESQKKEMVTALMREQTSFAIKINREQTRQERRVRDLRDQRRHKQEQREQQAATIIGIGERQKTIVQAQNKTERERQIESVRNRVARIKYERTLTIKEPVDESSPSGFNKLLTDKETDGLTEDEKMAKAARKLELIMRQEGTKIDEQTLAEESDKSDGETIEPSAHGVKLDEKMQLQKLKDRYKQKKKSRKNKNETLTEE